MIKAIGSEGAWSSLTFDGAKSEFSTSSGSAVQWLQGASATIRVSSAPTITQVSPPQAWGGGGTAITLSGTNFASGATVQIGGRNASSVTVVNSTTITAKTPPVAVFGDVTGDGFVKLVDAICVLRRASNLAAVANCPEDKQVSPVTVVVTNPGGQTATSATPFVFVNADVNGDGFVKLVDAICVLRRASNLSNVANCPSPTTYPQ